MGDRGGTGLSDDPVDRRRQLQIPVSRGLDRGVCSAIPIEDLVIGTDLTLAAVDVGHMPFVLAGLSVIATDVGAGVLGLGLYRVDEQDVLPTRWSARLSGFTVIRPSSSPYEYMGTLPQPKEIDRIAAAWIVGVVGSTATMTVRGCESYTMPSFAGWKMPGAGLLQQIDSRSLTFSRKVPAVGLLTLAGARLRGTGKIG